MKSSYNKNFEAIGTHWYIEFESKENGSEEKIISQILERIELFDKNYSRFRDDSLVTKISQKAGTYTLPEDSEELMDIYKKMYSITRGKFTPLIGATLSEAGYDKNYSFRTREISPVPNLDSVLSYDKTKLITNKKILLDFGAAGKGYLIDIIAGILIKNNVTSYMIDAGGDILVYSSINKNFRIGLEHPEDKSKVIGVANITNKSICGSAGSIRKWGEYHHIIDPDTLASPKEIIAVWVVADKAIIADAIATCLFLVPVKSLISHYAFEYCLLKSDFSVESSKAFPAELYTN